MQTWFVTGRPPYLLMTGKVKVMRSEGGLGESATGRTQPSLAAVCDLHSRLFVLGSVHVSLPPVSTG